MRHFWILFIYSALLMMALWFGRAAVKPAPSARVSAAVSRCLMRTTADPSPGR